MPETKICFDIHGDNLPTLYAEVVKPLQFNSPVVSFPLVQNLEVML